MYSILFDRNLLSEKAINLQKSRTGLSGKNRQGRPCRSQNKCNSRTEILFGMGRKNCGKKVKMLVTSIFSFSHNVFKWLFLLGHLKSGLCGKEYLRYQNKCQNNSGNIYYGNTETFKPCGSTKKPIALIKNHKLINFYKTSLGHFGLEQN